MEFLDVVNMVAEINKMSTNHIEIDDDDDDFLVDDYAGGNIDDAYELGLQHGEVLYARHLLYKFSSIKA